MRSLTWSLWSLAASMGFASSTFAGPIPWSYRVNVQFADTNNATTAGQSSNGNAMASFQAVGGGDWVSGSSGSTPLADILLYGQGYNQQSFVGTFDPSRNAFRIDVTIRDDATGETATTHLSGGLTGSIGYTRTGADSPATFVSMGTQILGAALPPFMLDGQEFSVIFGTAQFPTSAYLSYRGDDFVVPISQGSVGSIDASISVRETPEPASLVMGASAFLALAVRWSKRSLSQRA